jgi:hypothetical protein
MLGVSAGGIVVHQLRDEAMVLQVEGEAVRTIVWSGEEYEDAAGGARGHLASTGGEVEGFLDARWIEQSKVESDKSGVGDDAHSCRRWVRRRRVG